MSITPIATTAARARERLAASLAALQQDNNVPAGVMDVVQGIARAIGPLFQLEKGGDAALLFQARVALQETLAGMQQSADQNHPAVADATAAIAQSLGMLFAAIREHGLTEPGGSPGAVPVSQPPPQPAPAPAVVHAAPPVAHAPVVATAPTVPVAEFSHQPPAASAVAPTVNAAPAYSPQPVPLVQPAQQPVPLVQPAQQPVPLAASAVKDPQRRSKAPTVFPETAARPQTGISGLPRLEAELGVHSESNFYTDFLGDITNHGGIFVATWTAVAIGTACEVELQFPGDLRADVQGVVRWRRQVTDVDSSTSPGLGVEITRANDEAWGLIKRFISKRDPIIQDV
ncbi:MAG: hypothetical protein U0325_05925 [Polyangiales bacterium]